jgi:flavin-dependent dehydrogenase
MIGDSSGIIAPLAGDGIGIAMESGKLIADLYLKRKKERLTHDQISYLYEKEWNKLFLNRIKKAKIIQNLIINRYGREAGFRLVKIFPALLPYLIKSTRNTSSKKI